MSELADDSERNLFFPRKSIMILRSRNLHRNLWLCKEDHGLYGKFLKVKIHYSGYLYSHLIKPCLIREKHESETKKAIGYRFFPRRQYQVHVSWSRGKTCYEFVFYIGLHLKGFAAL